MCFLICSECVNKFGENVGGEIWEAVNKCFDCMPIAATVDDKVLLSCAVTTQRSTSCINQFV